MIKTLKQLFFVIALLAGISVSASAQKEDKKPPPKEGKPPVIIANPEKKPKEDKPKEDKPESDKKPQFIMYKSKYTISLV